MRKFSLFLFNFIFVFMLIASGVATTTLSASATGRFVYIGGNSAGFLLGMGGVQVIAVSEVRTEGGTCCPAQDAGLKNGDIITAVDGETVSDANRLNEYLNRSNGKQLILNVKREGNEKELTITPQKELNSGKYKIGVLIRDTLSGIGTITYIDKENGRFGALGHGVYDENSNMLNVAKGKVYGCSIVSVSRGIRGKAGELKGVFMGENTIGTSDTINECGLYGVVDKNIDYSRYKKVEIAPLGDARMGEAYIYSTVNGLTPQKFAVSIVKVDEYNKDNKNFVIKITDKCLIEQTGGIVQGMSGSPIIQDGKLIGAVTHVFLNDPTRGYGIGIENMLDR